MMIRRLEHANLGDADDTRGWGVGVIDTRSLGAKEKRRGFFYIITRHLLNGTLAVVRNTKPKLNQPSVELSHRDKAHSQKQPNQ